ncbi:unnamed protein product, partial [Darwinula stevensoni]
INFGLDDDTNILVDTDDWSDKCESGQIWDPFGNFCRDVYCSPQIPASLPTKNLGDVISGRSRYDAPEKANSLRGSPSSKCIHVGNQLHVWMWIYGEENLEKPPVTDLKTGLVFLGWNSSWDSSRDSDLDSDHNFDRNSLLDSDLDSDHNSDRNSSRDSDLDSDHNSDRNSTLDSDRDSDLYSDRNSSQDLDRDSDRYRPWRRIPHIGCFQPNPAGSCWFPPSEIEDLPRCHPDEERFLDLSYDFFLRSFLFFWDISLSDDESELYWMFFPPSLSVMINFGLDDDTNILVDTDDWSDKCESGQIWDPFGNFCRDVYCDDDYELHGNECIESDSEAPDDIFTLSTLEAIVILEVEAIGREEDWIIEEFERIIPTKIGSYLSISPSRILNVSLTLTGDCNWLEVAHNDTCHRDLTVGFLLIAGSDPDEPNVDTAVAQMTYDITKGRFFLEVCEVLFSVQGIHEYPTEDGYRSFQEWCRGGRIRKYMNDEFSLELTTVGPENDTSWEIQVVLTETDERYGAGEYVANIFFQGSIWRSWKNLSGAVAVCTDRPWIEDESCLRMTMNASDFLTVLTPDATTDVALAYLGDLPYVSKVLHRNEYRVLPSGEIECCIDPRTSSDWSEYDDVFEVVECISFVGMCVSVVGLGFILFTYGFFPTLRNTHGWNVFNLSFSLFAFQVGFLVGMGLYARESLLRWQCVFFAVFIHYWILAAFFWNNVLAIDLYRTFGGMKRVRNGGNRTVRYSLYAYSCPLGIVGLSLALDLTHAWNVGYGDYFCWIGNPLANTIVLALPMVGILVCNGILYALTVTSIRRTAAEVNSRRQGKGMGKAKVYARMSAAMGFTWLAGILPSVFSFDVVASLVFVVAFVCLNATQGVYVFVAFGCNSKIFRLYGDLFARESHAVHRETSAVYEDNSQRRIYKWYDKFAPGRPSVVDDAAWSSKYGLDSRDAHSSSTTIVRNAAIFVIPLIGMTLRPSVVSIHGTRFAMNDRRSVTLRPWVPDHTPLLLTR